MPPRTHKHYRLAVCVICVKKGNSPRPITETGQLLKQIQRHWIENYDPKNPKLPLSVCGRCRMILSAIDKGGKTTEDLPDPVDFSEWKYPGLGSTRSSIGLDQLDEQVNCQCDLCRIGRVGPNTDPIQYNTISRKPYNLGRPKQSSSSRLPPRVPITICFRCLQLLKKGESHPSNCGIQERRDNVQSLLESDPRGYEIAASKLIKSKAESAPKDSPTISLATAGPSRQLTLKRPYTRSVTKARYTNSPVPASEVLKMQRATKMTGVQLKTYAKFERSWHERSSLEPHLDSAHQESSHIMQPFFSTTKCMLDSKNAKEREMGKVERVVVHCKDMYETIKFVCEQRGYSDMSNTYLKIAADTGKGSFKINASIVDMDSTTPTQSKTAKWSYEEGPGVGDYKDSGVKRIILLGKFSSKIKEHLLSICVPCALNSADNSY